MRSPFSDLVRRLGRRAPLSQADRDEILALPHQLRSHAAGAHLLREGERPDHCTLLLSGFACRYKVTGDGSRQILSFHVPTDFLDLQNALLPAADHSVQLVTPAEVALVPRQALSALAFERPAVGRALWVETLVDSSIFREWVVNVGRRDSRSRVGHLLCEIGLRLQLAGLSDGRRYSMPMTQEQLADAAGLTAVHVNRVLKQLVAEGLIRRDKRMIEIPDWERLAAAADFNERYLHQQETAAA